MSTEVQLGRTLRDARRASRLNHQDVATAVGVDIRTVIRWELDQAEPDGFQWLCLCILYGEDLGYFLGEHRPRLRRAAA